MLEGGEAEEAEGYDDGEGDKKEGFEAGEALDVEGSQRDVAEGAVAVERVGGDEIARDDEEQRDPEIAPADDREDGRAAEHGVKGAGVPEAIGVAEVEDHYHQDCDAAQDVDARVAVGRVMDGWGRHGGGGNALSRRGIGEVDGSGWGEEADCASLFRPITVHLGVVDGVFRTYGEWAFSLDCLYG